MQFRDYVAEVTNDPGFRSQHIVRNRIHVAVEKGVFLLESGVITETQGDPFSRVIASSHFDEHRGQPFEAARHAKTQTSAKEASLVNNSRYI